MTLAIVASFFGSELFAKAVFDRNAPRPGTLLSSFRRRFSRIRGCFTHLGQPHTYLLRCDQAGVTILSCLEELLAEGVGFEPTVGLLLRLISSQVPSTTQPPFRYA